MSTAGAKKKIQPRPQRPKVEEIVISKIKTKEYLDNYQYHESKDLKDKNPSVVVHIRLNDPSTGTVEGYSYSKTTKTSQGGNVSGSSATNSKTSTTKVGRRGGAGGATSTTTTTTSTKTTTARTRH